MREKTLISYFSHAPTGDLARNLGTCPDWELNRRPSLWGMMPNQLSHTGQGASIILSTIYILTHLILTILEGG